MKLSKQMLALIVFIVCVVLSQFISFFYVFGVEPVSLKNWELSSSVVEESPAAKVHESEVKETEQKVVTLPPVVIPALVSMPQLVVQKTAVEPVKLPDSAKRSSSEFHYPGNKKTALVIVAYNRPAYLERTMGSLIETLSSSRNHVLVDIVLSQDGYLTVLDDVVLRMRKRIETFLPQFTFRHIHHAQENRPGDSGYHKLARHFGWFLHQLFIEDGYEQVIILEDDLEIAPDFFEYFDATSPLLWKDPTLYCVSAWNDNGQASHVKDPSRLFRSDFFPGLGWMLTRTIWDELDKKWPGAYWDDWLRHPDQRKNRCCIRPEISRSYTFGEKGTSNSQFYGEFLRGILKNDQFVEFTKMDLDFLLKKNFDVLWQQEVNKAVEIATVSQIPENDQKSYKILFDKPSGSRPFPRLAKQLGIMTDEKAGVYRTAYMGVVAIRFKGTQVYLVPREGPSFSYV